MGVRLPRRRHAMLARFPVIGILLAIPIPPDWAISMVHGLGFVLFHIPDPYDTRAWPVRDEPLDQPGRNTPLFAVKSRPYIRFSLSPAAD